MLMSYITESVLVILWLLVEVLEFCPGIFQVSVKHHEECSYVFLIIISASEQIEEA